MQRRVGWGIEVVLVVWMDTKGSLIVITTRLSGVVRVQLRRLEQCDDGLVRMIVILRDANPLEAVGRAWVGWCMG